ncbi:hypothetical protein FOA43_003006 [Brettanomyces nanus]|uniref:Uncharacterized protein n=1 Tax=Eeniella nana TaxID=13502 RepID=A0A875S7G2_EENNA|nr:uncharacterized protein FOA43_003006 [Brettanomyces nanus]QPG75649.1 hypothetical protein FOA43_003006 [Brettanomyces nanus]
MLSQLEETHVAYTNATPTDIPNQTRDNPFIQQSKYRQGTLYLITLPTIAVIFIIFLLCTAYMKYRAKHQARQAPPFEDMCEAKSETSGIFDLEQATRATTLVSKGTFETVEKIGLARSSMEIDGLQGEGSDGTKGSGTGSTTFYSLEEPNHAATQSTVSIPNNKKHFHKKTLSSVILDEFISTGELPAEDPNDTSIQYDPDDTDINITNHSMFEQNCDTSYNADLIRNHKPSSPVRKSRTRLYRSANNSVVFGSPGRLYTQESPTRSSGRYRQ